MASGILSPFISVGFYPTFSMFISPDVIRHSFSVHFRRILSDILYVHFAGWHPDAMNIDFFYPKN